MRLKRRITDCRQNANKFRSEPTALDTSCDRTLPAGILVSLGQECGALLQPLQVVMVKRFFTAVSCSENGLY